jgi:hypothetical protein
MKCKFYKKCKYYDQENNTCNVLGGMYYEDATRPAGCYVRMEQNE